MRNAEAPGGSIALSIKASDSPFRPSASSTAALVSNVEDFSTLETKAAVLDALGRNGESDALMDKAMELPGVSAFLMYQYGSRQLAAGKKPRSLDVFERNRRQHPGEKFWTYLGLARGYTALGDKKKAIESWEIAIANVPPAQKGSLPAMRRALEKLKAS